ncbi:hypothetical protein M433DRAFT_141586 [Acidomyces richmondensis BFW]|nr:MAG: hypothetical protein FE78DRAFT_28271 [Acidomyces sp. 'richmondensis']KYG47873.1 hypothetical protein M433DRAFT_141586 [Acidomyces richmondensis BFW]
MEEQADAEQERSSCPSPSMQSAPPQQQQQYPSSYSQQQQQQQNASEQPSASMQHAPLLPPIQHFEGVPQYVAMNGVPPPMQHHPPPYPPTLYGGYGGSGGMAAPSNGMMRYAAIPQAPVDARQMSGGRHKKEIKRRTKTGCLTCRKRRIKCDEGQPSCRNCAKSKRDCLGYDPIFKQAPAPAPIAAKPDATAAPPPSGPPNTYPPSQPYPASAVAFPDYGGVSLDPALGGGDHPLVMAPNAYSSAGLVAERRVRHITMDQLFAINDIPPQYQKHDVPPPLPPAALQEVTDFYEYHFARGLNLLLETDWYTVHGATTLQSTPELLDLTFQCAEQLKTRNDNPSVTNHIRSLESLLVWNLALMPRSSLPGSDLSARIDTLQNLLTGQFLDPTRLPAPPQPGVPPEKHNEQAFWHNLGRFTAIHDDGNSDDPTESLRQIADALTTMRGLLGMLENRDVLYSIAIGRHIGGRMLEFQPPRRLVASSNNAHDEVNKLKVAHQFVENEDAQGTTQVIQRICSMALRSWTLQKR